MWNLGLNLGSVSVDLANQSHMALENPQSFLNSFSYKRELISLTSQGCFKCEM